MDVVRAANEREARGEGVLHLEVGQPSTGAPHGVIEAAAAALRADKLGYTDSFGIPALRHAIARHYRDWYGLNVPMERVVVTTGSSGAFLLSFLASFDPGDRVVMVEPAYPCYKNILNAIDVEPVCVPGEASTNYQPTPEILDRIPGRIDGLIVASPNNPTGSVIPPAEFKALAEHCGKRGIRLISDEIYHGITYGTAGTCALAFNDDAFVINSFSKYFSMTGWRIGWMIVPKDLLRAVECLAQNLFISAPTLSQHAAVAAFACHAELRDNVAKYARNRALLLEQLPKAGFDRLVSADGAFYIYADVAHLTNDSEEFCRRMLSETGVAATPGVDFDPARGKSFMRFSYAGATHDMEEAARRLRAWRA
ncbi:MAG: pyridoxal phosphate-dependent aminotransferase [Alphaproteobacteria bacterium]